MRSIRLDNGPLLFPVWRDCWFWLETGVEIHTTLSPGQQELLHLVLSLPSTNSKTPLPRNAWGSLNNQQKGTCYRAFFLHLQIPPPSTLFLSAYKGCKKDVQDNEEGYK